MKTLLFLMLTMATGLSQATTYYACDDGDDGNDGLTTSTPFGTFAKAMDTFRTMGGGDSVLLCRGGEFEWTEVGSIYNTNCAAGGSECTFGAYGDSLLERPKVEVLSGTAFDFEDSGTPNWDGGYVIKDLILYADPGTSTGYGINVFNEAEDIIIDNMYIDGFAIGINFAGSNANPVPPADGRSDNIVVTNSVFINNWAQGMLGTCDNCRVENSVFENNGYNTPGFDHNVYLSGASGGNYNFVFKNNTLYKSTRNGGVCKGVSLVVHGNHIGLVIEGNTVREDYGLVNDTCYGISVDPGYAREEYFTDILIKGNTIINMGGVGIGCASCDGVTIQDNTIIGYDSTMSVGIAVPVKEEDTVKSDDVVITGNRILLTRTSADGIRAGGTTDPFTITNNEITQPDTLTGDCILLEDSNVGADISTNTCTEFPSISWP